jgi:hypothetical protein
MVKLTFDQSPCDFKNTQFKFRSKFFFKKAGLELATGSKKGEVIDTVVDTIFDRMFNRDVFLFRDFFVDAYKDTSLSHKESLDVSSITEYLLIYTLSVLDMAGTNLLTVDTEAYIQSSAGWFPPISDNPTYLAGALASLRSPGIVSIDKQLEEPSKEVVNAILIQHLTQGGKEIRSGFAAVEGLDTLKIIWQ